MSSEVFFTNICSVTSTICLTQYSAVLKNVTAIGCCIMIGCCDTGNSLFILNTQQI